MQMYMEGAGQEDLGLILVSPFYNNFTFGNYNDIISPSFSSLQPFPSDMPAHSQNSWPFCPHSLLHT